jgi:D-galactarolactone cycloisomerase
VLEARRKLPIRRNLLNQAFKISSLEAFVFRCPTEQPVETSFGTMRDRPAVFLRLTDEDGVIGWGEVWCNFPACGAEHRANLIKTVFAPIVAGFELSDYLPALANHLTARTSILALQSSEPGPIAQCIAGIDLALWDLAARKASLPLWKFLGGHSGRIPVYASGLNPTAPQKLAAARLADGYRSFKLKIGFGTERDLANLAAVRNTIGDNQFMIDANQAFDSAAALEMATRAEPFNITWLEEPIRADRPLAEWQSLARDCPIPLAAGENIAGEQDFANVIASRSLRYVQPDAAKWGGISGCLAVARAVFASGAVYCPHYLGAGVGLLASAHLLAAVGGSGMLEIDANPNPLRTQTCGPLNTITEGMATLGDGHGIGIAPDLEALEHYRVVTG